MSTRDSAHELAVGVFPGDPSPADALDDTLVALLHRRCAAYRERRMFTFLADGETDEVHCSHGELEQRATAVAAALARVAAPGDRALLLFAPGIDYIVAFFGCVLAGVVAVPAYPPDPMRLARTLPKLRSIARDCGARVVLTSHDIRDAAGLFLADAPELAEARWLAVDELRDEDSQGWVAPEVRPETIAFLQYTSGSTGDPKGVIQTHRNIMHNLRMIRQGMNTGPEDVAVSWLPPFHDMGLVGFILEPLYIRAWAVSMSPIAFLQRPVRWLRAISRYRGTLSGAPNFAFDLCVRRVSAADRETLDLSSIKAVGCAAEPIRTETLRRFTEAFAPCGFEAKMFFPCYGLAESTLIVTGARRRETPTVRSVDRAALAKREVREVPATAANSAHLVGCGDALLDETVHVVDPSSHRVLGENEVGEIWVSSASVGAGYWGRPELSAATFGVRLDGSMQPFLRTGDLGFFRGDHLFITGRHKDLLIVHGANHHPEDIEATVEKAHPLLRPGGGAVFQVDERVVVVHEVAAPDGERLDDVVAEVRRAVAEVHDIPVDAVTLIRRSTLPKTTSGKIQRSACRTSHMEGSLDVVHRWERALARDAQARAAGTQALES